MNDIKCPYCHYQYINIKYIPSECVSCENGLMVTSSGVIKISKFKRSSYFELFYQISGPLIFLILGMFYFFTGNQIAISDIVLFGFIHIIGLSIHDAFYRRDHLPLLVLYFKFIIKMSIKSFKVPEKYYFISSLILVFISIVLLIADRFT